MRLLAQLWPEHWSPLKWNSALRRGEQGRARSETERQEAEILYFHSGSALTFSTKASCSFWLCLLGFEKCLSALQSNCEIEMLMLFLYCQLFHTLVLFFLYRPVAHRIFVSSMRKTRCWCRSKHFPVLLFICTCLLCLYTYPCVLPACHLRDDCKIFGNLPCPIP